jgi:hypothetical protein
MGHVCSFLSIGAFVCTECLFLFRDNYVRTTSHAIPHRSSLRNATGREALAILRAESTNLAARFDYRRFKPVIRPLYVRVVEDSSSVVVFAGCGICL